MVTLPLCGTIHNIYNCTLSMEMLMTPPYNLKVGDDISNRVTVSAYNALGWSQQSIFDKTTPRVKVSTWPEPVTNLRIDSQNAESVSLKWDKTINHFNAIYTIYMASGTILPFSKLHSTPLPAHTISNLTISQTYRFRIEVTNQCGSSESTILSLSLAKPPSRMDPVKTVEDGCGVRFSWTEPEETGGADITGYVLTMKTKLG